MKVANDARFQAALAALLHTILGVAVAFGAGISEEQFIALQALLVAVAAMVAVLAGRTGTE